MKPFLLLLFLCLAPYSHGSLCHDVASAMASTPQGHWEGIDLRLSKLRWWLVSHPHRSPKAAFLTEVAAINGVMSGIAIVPPGFRFKSSPHLTLVNVDLYHYSTTELRLADRLEIRRAWEIYFDEGKPLPDFEKVWSTVGENVSAEEVGRGFNFAFFEEDPHSRIEPSSQRQAKRSARQTDEDPKLVYHYFLGSRELPIAYLAIRTFGGSAVPRYVARSLDKIAAAGSKGLILDLRDNGGGGVDEIKQVAGYFLGKGVELFHERSLHSREPRTTLNLTITARRVTLPLIVLVNGGTASASEILAGILQHHGNAYLVGERTHGKGTVLSAQELLSGPGLFADLPITWTKTTGVYYLPSNKSPQRYGLPVDFVVESGRTFIRESDYPTALENPEGPIVLRPDATRDRLRAVHATLPVSSDDVVPVDKQFFAAYDLMQLWLGRTE